MYSVGGGSGSGTGKSTVVAAYVLPKSDFNVTRHGPWPAKVSTVRMGRVRVADAAGSTVTDSAATGSMEGPKPVAVTI